jgi:LysR family transcriptional activator of nhaA
MSAPTVRLAVGICDSLPKLVVRRHMQPVIAEPNLRLLCNEGNLDDLLGYLALHQLDVVLSDRPARASPSTSSRLVPKRKCSIRWCNVCCNRPWEWRCEPR